MSGSISSTTAPGAAAPAAGAASGAGSGPRLSADLGTFLKLLTTQLRNQDPTKPMDTETLTQQLVQFATVEQQIQGNQRLSQLLDLQQAGQLAGTAGLVGRRVTMEANTLPLQNGRAEVVLPPAGRARQAVVEVRDAAGAVIRSATVPLGAGPTNWQWDGRDSAGTQRPDGAYRVAVGGRAQDGSAAPLSFSVTGLVTGAARQDGELALRLGSASIGFDRLRELPGGS
jgi:flagellar basal-body rod modification protein FlgD